MKTRRDFLRISACGAVGMAAFAEGLERFGLVAHQAQAAPNDYRALVCIFMFGGNDANNMVVPVYGSGYNTYLASRGGSLALAQGSLLQITPASMGLAFGLHPAMTGLRNLWNLGKVAVVANVGPLTQPTTKNQYKTNPAFRPYQLFSHSDQQSLWMATRADLKTNLGWGGLSADNQVSFNGGSAFPPVTSLAGNNQFNKGLVTKPLGAAPAPTALNQILVLNGFTASATDVARKTAMNSLRTYDTGVPLVKATSDVTQDALNIGAALAVDPVLATVFPNTSLGNQLKQVAKIMKLNQTAPQLSLNRQVFFCSIGGFDTHQDQLGAHTSLFGQLSNAMTAFYNATIELGISGRVTTFTESDFGRTLAPSGTGVTVGSDHAWGNHQFVMGGSVKGGDFYGVVGPNGSVFQDLTLGNANALDTDSRGRWIPTCSVDQYGATLAQWFGVSPVDAQTIFPLLYRFAPSDLGFLMPAA
jgi:uncharacterized protein (DUF1501 family)